VSAPLIVLKFGGSVLADPSRLPLVVHEIYRWRRQGHDVVAVVSAFAGVTDALVQVGRAHGVQPTPHAVAAVVANGELQSAALLALRLDIAGVPARMLSPAVLRLTADGDPLDATPVDLDEALVRVALDAGEVLVVPGFVACARDGRAVLLGRGGSDLTALFLASRLRADRCRLVKDVDGLYEHDPARSAETFAPPPRRFAAASWDDALATDGTIIQRKALHFARANDRPFELGSRNGTRPTLIGAQQTRLSEQGVRERRAPLRVALLGLGTVGAAVRQRLAELPEDCELIACAVRDPGRRRSAAPHAEGLTADVLQAATCGAEVVIEALGGVEPAREALQAALRAGAHVITANKAVLAAHGAELGELAQACGGSLRWSAAAGGAMPVLEAVARLAGAEPLLRVDAVLNGTSNFVLDAVARGATLPEAHRQAQLAGFAERCTERDAERDLSGRDAADKLVLVHHAATGLWLSPHEVQCTPITEDTLAAARRPGTIVRQVATLQFSAAGCRAEVRPLAVRPEDPLFTLPGEGNAAALRTASGVTVVRGRGAGGEAAATAVLSDLLELSRELQAQPPSRKRRAERGTPAAAS